jgi:hypothetical protein
LPKLIVELALVRADGSYLKAPRELAKVELLLLDDRGLSPVDGQAANGLMGVADDRAGIRLTVIVNQLPVSDWHHLIADPGIAEAVLGSAREPLHADRGHWRVDARKATAQGRRLDLKPGSPPTLARRMRRFASRCSAWSGVTVRLAAEWPLGLGGMCTQSSSARRRPVAYAP